MNKPPSQSWNTIRQQVYERADGCCEYCQTCEINTGQTMHVDHIDPDSGDILENLCLACWNCNTSKHTATVGIDPITRTEVTLFNPRVQVWHEHFEWTEQSTILLGLTPCGRTTIERLKINRSTIVAARKRWVNAGYHPPD